MYTIEQLEKLICHHNDLYWNNKPLEISDIEYDELVEQLRALDPKNPLLNEFGKSTITNDQKLIKHTKPMLSLGKVYNFKELYDWICKVSRSDNEQFLIQPKYDGMSGLLENGKLSSRGDGIYGQDYTDKLSIIEFDLPKGKTIDPKRDYLLGEIVIRNSDFKNIYSNNIKSKSGETFKTQRNGIAGIIGTDDIEFYRKQHAVIAMVDYDLISYPCNKKQFTLMGKDNNWEKLVNKILETVDYPLDGIVIKLADKTYSDSLGCTAHHPRGQIAYKFTNQNKESKLIGIEWGMGKEQISAIGLIEPIEISGVTIKRVKLQLTKPKCSNISTCLIDNTLQIGDTVTVERAGDIIPHVVNSKPGKNRTPVILNKCPFCGGNIEISSTSIRCVNDNCHEKLIQNLYNSIVSLQFKNVGDKYIRLIVDNCPVKINNLYDLLTLKIEDLSNPIFGIKMKEIFIGEVQKALNGGATKINFLTALNIPNIGKNISNILVNNFKWDDIIDNSFDYYKFAAIDGVGPTIVSTLYNFFKKNQQFIARLNSIFNFVENDIMNNNIGKKTVCFTGKMEMKRSDMMKLAQQFGLNPVDTVDKNLDILICADPNSGSSKLQKAIKYGIKVVSEQDFKNGKF